MSKSYAPAYRLVEGWAKHPAAFSYKDVSGVAVDSRDRVYVITRFEPRVIVYDPDGAFVQSWGEGFFTPRTHGITIGPDDSVYCVNEGDHTVSKFTPDGALVMTLGTSGVAADTGYDGRSLATITHGGPPFNRPTNLALAPNGEIYVTDGYGNCRVHRFSPNGRLIQSWGEPGTGPGQFNLPHGLSVSEDGRVWVADRENDRIQIFDPEGRFLEEWTQVQRPTNVRLDRQGRVCVSELWWPAGSVSMRRGVIPADEFSRVSILDTSGSVIARIGGQPDPEKPGNLVAPHDLAVDSKGSIYVGEVTHTFAVLRGQVPEGTHCLQKFARVD